MHPDKVQRDRLRQLTDLPNVGTAVARDLHRLGITHPAQLSGADPYELYHRLCSITGVVHDPCMIDVLISIVRFVNGEPPQVWWAFTDERKHTLKQMRKQMAEK